MIEAEGYSINVSCDNRNHLLGRRTTFYGVNKKACRREMLAEGWTIINGEVLCPACNERLVKEKE